MKKYLVTAAVILVGLLLIGKMAPLFATVLQDKGYILEQEVEIGKKQPGPHDGGGMSTAYGFFSKAENLKLVFRKRTLYPGSSIGYHLQEADEIYYIVQGTGEMKMNGKTFPVKAGDAILTRPGNWHGLRPAGKDSLTLIINYLNTSAK